MRVLCFEVPQTFRIWLQLVGRGCNPGFETIMSNSTGKEGRQSEATHIWVPHANRVAAPSAYKNKPTAGTANAVCRFEVLMQPGTRQYPRAASLHSFDVLTCIPNCVCAMIRVQLHCRCMPWGPYMQSPWGRRHHITNKLVQTSMYPGNTCHPDLSTLTQHARQIWLASIDWVHTHLHSYNCARSTPSLLHSGTRLQGHIRRSAQVHELHTCSCMGVQPACSGFSSSAGILPDSWLT